MSTTTVNEESTENQTEKKGFFGRIISKIKDGARRVLNFIRPSNGEGPLEFVGRIVRKTGRFFLGILSWTFTLAIAAVILVVSAAIGVLCTLVRLITFLIASPMYLVQKRFTHEFRLTYQGWAVMYVWLRELFRNGSSASWNSAYDADESFDSILDEMNQEFAAQRSKGKETPKQKKSTAGKTQSRQHKNVVSSLRPETA